MFATAALYTTKKMLPIFLLWSNLDNDFRSIASKTVFKRAIKSIVPALKTD